MTIDFIALQKNLRKLGINLNLCIVLVCEKNYDGYCNAGPIATLIDGKQIWKETFIN